MSVDLNSLLSGGLARTLHTLETDLVSGSEAGAQAAPTQNTELYNTSGPNANEPSLSDIQQGSYGDCYFLSSLGALARNDPNAVKNMIHDNGNGTYTVTFHVQNNGLHNLFGLTGNSYTTQQVTDRVRQAAPAPGFSGQTQVLVPLIQLCPNAVDVPAVAKVRVTYAFDGVLWHQNLTEQAVMRCAG